MDPEFLADPDPNSGKKVWSGSGQKDPDPKHWILGGILIRNKNEYESETLSPGIGNVLN